VQYICHLSDIRITIAEVKTGGRFMPDDFFYMKQSPGNGKKREKDQYG